MAKDVNELVLDAFRVEHREQLEQMRTLLGSLTPGQNVADDTRVRDAFRLAHSFKGGARVCDLREAERLGHGLEAVLEHLSRGDLLFTDDAFAAVNLVLDRIEDWMSALDGEQPLPDTSDALTAIEHVLADVSNPAPATPAPTKKSAQLLPVFCQEFEQHSARLRQLLALWNSSDCAPDESELAEAARVAHTLAGAAAVVEMHPVEAVAGQLEQFFRAVRTDQQRLDAAAQRQVEDWLNSMAETMAGIERESDSIQPAIAESQTRTTDIAIGQDAGQATEPPASISSDTVRVSVDSLDRLMHSSSEMLADHQHVARLTRRLGALHVEVNALERERDAIRRAAASSFHKLAEMKEFERVSRYLEYVDRQVSSLAKQTRLLFVDGRRAAWQLRARSAQVQRDVQEARLVPAHSVFQGFRKMVRDLAKSENKEIDFQVAGMDIRADRMVLQELKDPIMHVLRNCVSHGIESREQRRSAGKPESGRVSISLEVIGARLKVVVEDDGRGINVERIQRQAIRRGLLTEAGAARQSTEETLQLAFEPGLSTVDSVTELAGRGMGLAIVHDSVARLQGQTTLSMKQEGGVRVTVSVPIFVSTHRILLVACGDQVLAIPAHGIERLLRISKDKMETMEGQPIVTYERQPIRLTRLSDVLGQSESPPGDDQDKMMSVVLLKMGTRLLAVSVDALLEERDALILNLDEFAEAGQFAGGVLLDDGTVTLVVQPAVLMENAQRSGTARSPVAAPHFEQAEPAKVLIVDDSFTTRTLEKNILEAQGYEVGVAIDGVEALSLLRQQKFALVITDVEMPRMDGFQLLEQMKADRRLASTPVILVTSRDRQEDQQHGLDLGADAYIVKRKFDHQELLNTIKQLM